MFLERYSCIKPLNATHNQNTSGLYEAIYNQAQERMVIKALSQIASSDPKLREQIQHEITLSRKLVHPCILPLIDYGEGVFYADLPPVPFLVHPFIRNGSLARLLT